MIIPAGYRVLIKPDPIDEETDWGFKIVTNERDKKLEKAAQQTGEVVAIGDDAWSDRPKRWCEIGDKVMYSKYGGIFVKDPETDIEYVLVNDEDITAIIGA